QTARTTARSHFDIGWAEIVAEAREIHKVSHIGYVFSRFFLRSAVVEYPRSRSMACTWTVTEARPGRSPTNLSTSSPRTLAARTRTAAVRPGVSLPAARVT